MEKIISNSDILTHLLKKLDVIDCVALFDAHPNFESVFKQFVYKFDVPALQNNRHVQKYVHDNARDFKKIIINGSNFKLQLQCYVLQFCNVQSIIFENIVIRRKDIYHMVHCMPQLKRLILQSSVKIETNYLDNVNIKNITSNLTSLKLDNIYHMSRLIKHSPYLISLTIDSIDKRGLSLLKTHRLLPETQVYERINELLHDVCFGHCSTMKYSVKSEWNEQKKKLYLNIKLFDINLDVGYVTNPILSPLEMSFIHRPTNKIISEEHVICKSLQSLPFEYTKQLTLYGSATVFNRFIYQSSMRVNIKTISSRFNNVKILRLSSFYSNLNYYSIVDWSIFRNVSVLYLINCCLQNDEFLQLGKGANNIKELYISSCRIQIKRPDDLIPNAIKTSIKTSSSSGIKPIEKYFDGVKILTLNIDPAILQYLEQYNMFYNVECIKFNNCFNYNNYTINIAIKNLRYLEKLKSLYFSDCNFSCFTILSAINLNSCRLNRVQLYRCEINRFKKIMQTYCPYILVF